MDEVKRLISINEHDIMVTPREIALIKHSEIYVNTKIDSEVSTCVNAAMRDIARTNKGPITLYFESPGGDITSALSIYDCADELRRNTGVEIKTVCSGISASASAFLSSTIASKGQRYSYKNCDFLLHQPWFSVVQGAKVSDLNIASQHALRQREKMNKILAECTGHPVEKIEKDLETDLWLTAEEALEYGLIDEIL